ncbi:hypothetical protein INR49_020287 [Caranx melampygus]|nr:hypothetical protein INR49_020287 [Caranx melampygus]
MSRRLAEAAGLSHAIELKHSVCTYLGNKIQKKDGDKVHSTPTLGPVRSSQHWNVAAGSLASPDAEISSSGLRRDSTGVRRCDVTRGLWMSRRVGFQG